MGAAMPVVGRSLAIFIVSILMMCIAIVTVLLRLFVRLSLLRAFGWDDALMVAALVFFICLNVCCIVGSMNGVGHTIGDFTEMHTYKKALLWWWLGQILYIWASAVAKISIALALLRLAVKRIHRVMLWTLTGTVIAIGIMFWLVLLLACNPVSYFWERVDGTSTGKCMSMSTILDIAYFYSSVTILCDLALGILPGLLVWKLQMNRRTKFAVGGILGLGAIASVAVACRFPSLRFYVDKNFLYSTYQIAIWSVIETGLGIIAGSLITLRPLFRWLLDGGTDYKHKSPGQGKYGKSYPLYSMQSQGVGTKYWRPDIDPDDNNTTVITASSPRRKVLSVTSSQEALNPELSPGISANQVKIEQTFVRTVTEREN